MHLHGSEQSEHTEVNMFCFFLLVELNILRDKSYAYTYRSLINGIKSAHGDNIERLCLAKCEQGDLTKDFVTQD